VELDVTRRKNSSSAVRAEQVGDGRQIIVAVAKPLAATQQRVETRAVSG